VPVGLFSGNEFGFFTASAYGPDIDNHLCYGSEGIPGGLTGCYMRGNVAQKLIQAEKLLPVGYHFVIYDAWRSRDIQEALYKQYYEKLKIQNPGLSDEKLAQETQKFVSLPSIDPKKPSTHNTGGAIDLTIFSLPAEVEIRVAEIKDQIAQLDEANDFAKIYELEIERHNLIAQNATELNFGTVFDKAGDIAAPDYYEKLSLKRDLTPKEIEARDNRRLLYNAMTKVGGLPYPDEYWHFNFDNQMAAVSAGKSQARYGAAEFTPELVKHEDMLKGNRAGLKVVRKAVDTHDFRALKIIESVPLGGLVTLTTKNVEGDITETSLPQIEAISPDETEKVA